MENLFQEKGIRLGPQEAHVQEAPLRREGLSPVFRHRPLRLGLHCCPCGTQCSTPAQVLGLLWPCYLWSQFLLLLVITQTLVENLFCAHHGQRAESLSASQGEEA